MATSLSRSPRPSACPHDFTKKSVSSVVDWYLSAVNDLLPAHEVNRIAEHINSAMPTEDVLTKIEILLNVLFLMAHAVFHDKLQASIASQEINHAISLMIEQLRKSYSLSLVTPVTTSNLNPHLERMKSRCVVYTMGYQSSTLF